jgi:hypothetical protein
MKKVIIGMCLLLAAFLSCNQKSGSSVKDNIVGKWKVVKDATDLNGNGKIDANEEVTDTANADFLLIFDANGSFTITAAGIQVAEMTWTLENDNTVVRTIDTSSGARDTTYQHIDNITATNMTLKDSSVVPVKWSVFVKQ